MGEKAVISRTLARLKFSWFDKFEARNRPHLHILLRYHPLKKKKKRNEKTTDFITIRNDIKCLQH